MMEQRTGKGDEIRREATELFLAKGYSGTSMSSVARAARVQKASLYHHYPSKEALFVACVTEGQDELVARLEAVRTDGDRSVTERMDAVLAIIYDALVLSPAGRMCPLIAETSRVIPEVARAFWDHYISRMRGVVYGVLEDGIEAGVFRTVERTRFDLAAIAPLV